MRLESLPAGQSHGSHPPYWDADYREPHTGHSIGAWLILEGWASEPCLWYSRWSTSVSSVSEICLPANLAQSNQLNIVYGFFSEAVHMQESYGYLTMRVKMEQQRFLSFAEEAGLLNVKGSLCATLQVNHKVLIATLVEIRALFKNYQKANQKYIGFLPQASIDWENGLDQHPELAERLTLTKRQVTDESLKQVEATKGFSLRRLTLRRFHKKARHTTQSFWTVVAEPKRLTWVTTDKLGFEKLVAKLNDLNNFLIALLDGSQMRRLEEAILASYREILQLRDGVKELESLSKAASVQDRRPPSYSGPPGAEASGALLLKAEEEKQANERHLQHLGKMASIKMCRVDAEKTDSASHPHWVNPASLLLDHPALAESQPAPEGPLRACRTMTTLHGTNAWVEWLGSPTRRLRDALPDSKMENRVLRLARLLQVEKPATFHAPRCLGYVRRPTDQGRLDFGFVFAPPPETHVATIRTLRQLLERRPKPALLARVALCRKLAESMDSFHAVDWLHKGFRSENVLFLGPSAAGAQGGGGDRAPSPVPSLAHPYVTGFELSRPRDMPDLTEKPPVDAAADIYRHPHAQSGDGESSFRKAFDLYGLGVVLLEVAVWRPIDDLLEFVAPPLPEVPAAVLRRVKARLLGEDVSPPSGGAGQGEAGTERKKRSTYLDEAARKCGDALADAIKECLAADAIESPAYFGESAAAMGVRLRLMFEEKVLRPLRLMEEALSGIPT